MLQIASAFEVWDPVTLTNTLSHVVLLLVLLFAHHCRTSTVQHKATWFITVAAASLLALLNKRHTQTPSI